MKSTILFDGVCNLCNGFVRFVIDRDPIGYFSFASLQSGAAERLLGGRALRGASDTAVLVENNRLYTESSAALRILRHLEFPWSLAYGFMIVPPPIRDWVYRVVARNRYQWFGKMDVCPVPTPEIRGRFLED